MDEPTAPLSERETDSLFQVINRLKSQGVAVIYISHRLEEIMRICDSIAVIRDGRNVCDIDAKSTNIDEIVKAMVGRDLQEKYPKIHTEIGEDVFSVSNLNAGNKVRNVSFSVKAGEVFGVAGLVGAGRTETMRAIFGIDPKDSGTIAVMGKEITINKPMDAIDAGIGFVTEDRKSEGLVLYMDVKSNITLASIRKFRKTFEIEKKAEEEEARRYIEKLNIRIASLQQKAGNLSGGNQQKVVLAKWLLTDAKVLILDEPTRGIDVGAKVEVYNIINDLIKAGVAVIIVSSESQELLGMADRIMVMSEGKVVKICENNGNLDLERIMHLASVGA